jgi:hypothetical protein
MKVETKPLVPQILQHAIPWRARALDSRTRHHEAKPRGLVSRPILQKTAKLEVFEETILPHPNAGYNLARWLMRTDQDAQDAVQEASLRSGSLKAIEGETPTPGCWPLSGIHA